MLLRKKTKTTEALIQYRKAKQLHKVEIAKLRKEIKAKQNMIKKHKMLKKQAKITYKITQQ